MFFFLHKRIYKIQLIFIYRSRKVKVVDFPFYYIDKVRLLERTNFLHNKLVRTAQICELQPNSHSSPSLAGIRLFRMSGVFFLLGKPRRTLQHLGIVIIQSVALGLLILKHIFIISFQPGNQNVPYTTSLVLYYWNIYLRIAALMNPATLQ